MRLETLTSPVATPRDPKLPLIPPENVALALAHGVRLRDMSCSLLARRTQIILRARGSGKSTMFDLMRVRAGLGLVSQDGALFDSLTVAENVGYKLYEESRLPLDELRQRVEEVLGFVRLDAFIDRMPSELSGGQRRRVAIARAMGARPGILLYDEATTGLDPITATTVDEEMVKLRDLEEVTSIIVTHQLRDAFFVAEHEAVKHGAEVRIARAGPAKCDEAEFIMLREGVIAFEGNAAELRASQDEYIREFLS